MFACGYLSHHAGLFYNATHKGESDTDNPCASTPVLLLFHVPRVRLLHSHQTMAKELGLVASNQQVHKWAVGLHRVTE